MKNKFKQELTQEKIIEICYSFLKYEMPVKNLEQPLNPKKNIALDI